MTEGETFVQIAERYGVEISEEDIGHILWSATAYPFAALDVIKSQFETAMGKMQGGMSVEDVINEAHDVTDKGMEAYREKHGDG